MADATPIKAVFNASNVATGLAEFQSSDTIALSDGGTGVSLSLGTAGQALVVNSGGTAIEFGTISTAGTALTGTTLASGITSSSLTSVGTLTTLTVDNVIINGTTIGHTSDTDLITLASGSVTIAGDLTISGDDLAMATNTSGHIMVADGTNFNPVAVSGDISIASNGAVTIANGAVETAMLNANVITGQSTESSLDTSNDTILIHDASASSLKKATIATLSGSLGGLSDVSGDSSPQLGGDLDVNGNSIVTTSNADINLTPNGTGDVVLGADTVKVGDSGAAATLTSNGAGTLTVTTGGAADLVLNTNSGTNSSSITITDAANGDITLTPNGTGDVVIDGLKHPQADGTSGQFLRTDGSGQLSFATVASDLSEDSSPQLGGDLDVNGNKITSASNANVEIEPNGTGNILLDSDLVTLGSGTEVGHLSTPGTQDIKLSTNSGTNSGTIVITDGSNGNITLTPNGTGDVALSADTVVVGDNNADATITTDGTGDLTLNTNAGTNSSAISIKDAANGNIEATLNGTGVFQIDGTSGVSIEQGAISIKNGGAESYVRFYCESSNAHYTQLQAAPHSAYSGNVTVVLPASADTLVGRATTDTLTNKTLTTPVIAEIDSGSTITLDATTDIILDADGGDIFFKDGGTTIATFTNSSSDFVVESGVSDKDIIFKVNDGGTSTEVMRLDGDVSALLFPSNKEIRFTDANESIKGDGSNLILTSGGTAFTIPSSDGTDGQFLKTDGSGALSFATASGSGGSLTIQDEGSSLSTAGTTLNFVGAGVTASGTGSTKTITINGTGSTTAYTPAPKFARLTVTENQSLSGSGTTVITKFNTRVVDTSTSNALTSTLGDGKFIIPAGVSKIKLRASVWVDDISGQTTVNFYKNGSIVEGTSSAEVQSDGGDFPSSFSAILSVSQNDYFQIAMYHGDSGTVETGYNERSWFELEVVEGSILGGLGNLATLENVHDASPSDGQALAWDNSNSYWAPKTVLLPDTTIGATETVSGDGSGKDAISLSTLVTLLNTSSGTSDLTLGSGTAGQLKIISMHTAGNAATLDTTDGNLGGVSTSIVFDAVGESVTLLYNGAKWVIVGQYGVTIS